jgi:hypothetical protein
LKQHHRYQVFDDSQAAIVVPTRHSSAATAGKATTGEPEAASDDQHAEAKGSALPSLRAGLAGGDRHSGDWKAATFCCGSELSRDASIGAAFREQLAEPAVDQQQA